MVASSMVASFVVGASSITEASSATEASSIVAFVAASFAAVMASSIAME